MSASKLILVSGDCVCDHNVYKGNRPTADSPQPRGVRVTERCGGALLLKELIGKATADVTGWRTEFGLSPDFKALPSECHAFCLWEPQMANPEEKDSKQQREVWRAVAPPLGYGHPGDKAPAGACGDACGGTIRGRTKPLAEPPEIVVLDDAGLGFRKAASRDQWPFAPEAKGEREPRWVVMKLAGALGTGDLWKEAVARYKHKLVLIVSADLLRMADVRISRGLSWEATAEDLAAELNSNPVLQPLLQARHLIVTFRSDGAFWMDNEQGETRPSLLVFDTDHTEGEWSESQGQGTTFGFMSCFVAAVVRELCRTAANDVPAFETALIAGLGAGRELRRLGHGPVTIKVKQSDGSAKEEENPSPGFPVAEIAARICQPTDRFVSAPIPRQPTNRGTWMMLDEWQVHARSQALQRPYSEVALAVAVLGPTALERFPVARFGGLRTVDRKEIESLRTIRQLISTYEQGGPQKKPLNIGVFGPPGAGKSFGVTQIARAVLTIRDEDILTFNLSQFCDPAALNGAFHRVRDRVLSGGTPLIFWDEFDAQGYRWLQYLLAPMQDGTFQDGQITHPIGKCVFIFAGATSPTFDAFGPPNPETLPPKELAKLRQAPEELRAVENQWREFVLKKGPDFKSRLVSYLNVLGPNPRQRCTEDGGLRRWEDDASDLCYPIRRALFIRAQFKVKDGQQLECDRGVLKALLEIPHYKSGARSLEFLCQQLQQHAPGVPRRSHLPGRQLLNMHVDAARFWELCECGLDVFPQTEALARGFHEDWRKNAASKGNEFNKPWEALDEATRSSNVQQALRISANLATVGLRIEKGPPLSANRERAVRSCMEKHLDILAEAEHNGWMVERMLAGWRYAKIPKKDSAKKLHPLLLPYAQLPEAEKSKDRRPIMGFIPTALQQRAGEEPVEGYIERLKRVGFRVTFAKESIKAPITCGDNQD